MQIKTKQPMSNRMIPIDKEILIVNFVRIYARECSSSMYPKTIMNQAAKTMALMMNKNTQKEIWINCLIFCMFLAEFFSNFLFFRFTIKILLCFVVKDSVRKLGKELLLLWGILLNPISRKREINRKTKNRTKDVNQHVHWFFFQIMSNKCELKKKREKGKHLSMIISQVKYITPS